MTDRILITSALPYVNGVKHIGNLAGSLLPADIHARFHRLRGRDVLFVCGTDEHGTPAEIAAAQAGLPVAEFCAGLHGRQADIYRRFGLSFDHFGRTSSPANHALTQDIFRRLEARGLIEERLTLQAWSATDGRFLPDRYVVGTCPSCRHPAARGDQCDGCGRLLDPADLISPRSALSGASDVELRETRHLFLRLSELAPRIRDWIEAKADWDPLVLAIARKWLNEGLQDRCITRDLSWGVPVPRPGYGDKRLYVWFDAPIGYIALVQEWAAQAPGRNWRDWLEPGADVRYVQALAQDNVPFHAIFFPAVLLGAAADIRLVDRIKGFHWLTYGGAKFSTSAGRGIFTDAALDEFPADVWRWWLAANAPETDDTDFSFERFAQDVNADLSNTVGNLVNRALSFAASRFGNQIPQGSVGGPAEDALRERAAQLLTSCTEAFEGFNLRRGTAGLRALWTLGNEYLTAEAPWVAIRTDPGRAACVLRHGLGLIALAAAASTPVIPDTAGRILSALGLPHASSWPGDLSSWLPLPATGTPVTSLAPLFPKVAPDRITELNERYRGQA